MAGGIPLSSNPVDASPLEILLSDWINNVRVLTIEPALTYASPLVCTMAQGAENFEFRLGHAWPPIVGTYEALSYSWGDPTPTEPMVSNGQIIKIAKNLNSALRHLRREDAPRRLWVDALCIKQDEIADKNCFIPIMHKIYATAEGTIVWLGEASTDSDDAISILEDAASRASQLTSSASQRSMTTVDILREAHNETDTKTWKALANFGLRPWWSRVWVMQEIACSKKSITAQCGRRTTTWFKLVMGIRELYERIIGMSAISEEFRPARNLEQALLMRPTESFFEALERGRGSNATDNRDKVFGVLHLSKNDEDIDLAIDYSNNIAEIYTATTRFLLANSDDLRLLALCDRFDGPVEQKLGLHNPLTKGLSSWVLNWADRRPYGPLSKPISNGITQVTNSGSAVPYKISTILLTSTLERDMFHDENSTSRRYSFTNDPTELKVRGAELGIIHSIGPVYDSNESHRNAIIKVMEWVQKIPLEASYLGKLLLMDSSDKDAVKQFIQACLHSQFDSMLRCLTCDRKADNSSFGTPLSFARNARDPEVITSVQSHSYGRRLCLIKHNDMNLMVLAPHQVKISDTIAVILGCPVPVILRKVKPPSTPESTPSGEYYVLVGVAYVDKLMNAGPSDIVPSSLGSDEFILR